MNTKKLLCIVGPTASGKTSLSIEIAQKYSGEIISADSRQVYRGLDIATGKVTREEMGGIPHHLLDVVEPTHQFSVAEYKELADKVIDAIHEKNKLPILVGGTGFYIQSVVDDLVLPEVSPNPTLRKELENKGTEELFEMLKEKDTERAQTIESKNPRRLIRALEIADALGSIPPLIQKERFNTLLIGLELDEVRLTENITKRTHERINEGMIEEAERLKKEIGLTRMKELGLEYRDLADFLEGNYTKEELVEKIIRSDLNYSKRQIRWFKKDSRIVWLDPENRNRIHTTISKWIEE